MRQRGGGSVALKARDRPADKEVGMHPPQSVAAPLPRIAYPHREHGVVIPDDYEAWETATLRDVPGIDPGIVIHVTLLRRAGVATIWSCQGGEGHEDPFPWVEFT